MSDTARQKPEPRVGDTRPGGRSARVRTAVLEATEELLQEVGYDKLTVDEVARRAGVHKTTIYRRWPTKPELIADAARFESAQAVSIPDTGSLAGDLRQLARDVARNIGTEGGGRRTRSIVASALTNEGASDLTSFWSHRMDMCKPIIERAVERGELPGSVDGNLVIESLVGPMWLRLLVTGGSIDERMADDVARLICAGATLNETPPPQ